MRVSKTWSVVLLFSTFILLTGYQNCGGQAPGATSASGVNANAVQASQLTVNGTVQKSSLDGCNYLISAVDNSDGQVKNFIPVNMDASLLQDGNQVSISGVLRTDLVSGCMAGSIIQVNSAQLIK